MRSPLMPLLQLPAPIVYPFLCVLSGHLPFCHSVRWDSLPLHGLCPRFNCQVCITRPPPETAGGTPVWNAAGAACSISFSAARLPRLRAQILLICGLICWIICHLMLSRPSTCARRCMLTLLTLRLFAAVACRGSWILSLSCQLVPALFLLLCVRFLPATSFWLGLLLLMQPCLLVSVCLLLVWCTVACALSRCRPLPVLPGVAPFPSAPSRVPRPKPLWGEAWSPICCFFFFHSLVYPVLVNPVLS
jgi:hypothetical protein